MEQKLRTSNRLTFIAVVIMMMIGASIIRCSNSGSDAPSAVRTATKTVISAAMRDNIPFNPQSAKEAIELAQGKAQYLAVVFYQKKDGSLVAMEELIKNSNPPAAKKPLLYTAAMADQKEQDIIKKYRIQGAPLPLLLMFAPNGAITGGFPQKCTTEQLGGSFVSEIVQGILKIVQAGKVAVIVLQNANTRFNDESSKAVDEFRADARIKEYVETIKADPNDAANAAFIAQCKLSTRMEQSTVVMMIPPGRIAGIFPGKTTKDALMGALASCSSGSGGGCCPK